MLNKSLKIFGGEKKPQPEQPEARRIDPSNPQPSIQEEMKNQPTQEPEALDQPLNTSSLETEPDHFNHLIEDAPDYEPASNSGAMPHTGLIEKDQFIKMYCGGFHAASRLTGIKSIDCSADEARCVEGFGALYETAHDIPVLHFMLRPTGKWLGRAMAMGMLFAPMAVGVSEELKAKQKPTGKADFAKAKEATKPKTPAYDGAPSPDQLETLTGGA